MKSTLFAISLLFIVIEAQSQAFPVFSVSSEISVEGIDNGWYDAAVSYYNPSTYQRSNHILSLKVEYDSVTVIDFGNGGSVHSGFNNSGYTYSGGSLSMKRDYQGNLVGATTRVSVSDSNGTRTFDISIE
jgi:hypothetical protein